MTTWNEPYLETCCRSALHRLFLTHGGTRPAGLPDEACLRRLSGMGMAAEVPPGRFAMTEAGSARHAAEVLRKSAA
ncbi:hypothetical protein [Muricoccus vinaceus]|uniref:Uncharacterized protein n=1 Tax=Muricoccus vinaceus TaxID=424704 RepID=A0ABV6IR89_9PROT